MGKKIVLIRPDIDEVYPFGKLPPYLPLGLGYLAGTLLQRGYEIEIVDSYLDGSPPEKVAERVSAARPIFAGISATIANIDNASRISKELVKKGVTVVIGGPQVTVFPEKTMKESMANIGVIGEGEGTVLEIAAVLEAGRKDLSGIKGIIYRDGIGLAVTLRREPIKDMDEIPFVPVEVFPYKKYAQDCPELRQKPLGWMSTSRGCPWDCSFCSNIYVWGRKYRSMSAVRVFREMKHLKEKFGFRAIDFREDNFTVNKKRVLELCDLIIGEGLDIEWKCESRVDIVDDELLRKMKKAGCGAVYFGIESGSQRVLDYLNKGFRVEDAEKALKACRENGIKTVASVMLGVPSQTLEENYETIAFLKRVSPDIVYFNPFIGIPGSKTYDHIRDRGLAYRYAGDIILPNSEFLSWPEKLKLKQKAEVLYNISPAVLAGHARRIGIKRLMGKAWITLKRYLSSRKKAR
jgi:anaerobic magnesium-protoporphyrin IX monomethyl ester cyclase